MALQKAITQQSGYDATYWRINRLEVNWQSKSATVRLAGYKDKQARKNNPQNGVMDQRTYRIGGEKFEQFFAIPDPSDYPTFDSTVEYSKGEIVKNQNALYQANESIASGGNEPANSASWDLYGDLRVNREIAYEYIKNNDIDFTDATKV